MSTDSNWRSHELGGYIPRVGEQLRFASKNVRVTAVDADGFTYVELSDCPTCGAWAAVPLFSIGKAI